MRFIHLPVIAFVLCLTGCSDTTDPGTDAAVTADTGPATEAGGDTGKTPDASAAANEVTTQKGKVKGTVKTGYREFLGIPYAKPPVGELRWKKPSPAEGWTKTRDATKLGHSCPQIAIVGLGVPSDFAEDCLTLNVWTPYPAPAKAAPVMVWIHGGGFTVGGSAQTTYNGAKMAARAGTVLVSINYRLGPLGFFAHPSLGKDSGNFGVLDQQAALGWVQKNIASFGGDPKNVTIFGESAGSMSVGVHQASPGSAGLFHRAIMESGGLGETLTTKAKAETLGKELVTKLKCATDADPIKCLRGKKVDDVINALPLKKGFFFGAGASWGPVIDGKLLPEQPMKTVQDGKGNKVPVLLGTNQDEGTLFLFLAGMMALNSTQYTASVALIFGAKAAEVLKEYPVSAYTSPALAFSDLLGDMAFICPTRRSARAFTSAGQSAFVYHFTVKPTFSLLAWLGAYHSAEIPFIFGTATKFSKDEEALSGKMMGFWTTFAKSGDPNDPKSSTLWPKYDKTADAHQVLALKLSTGKGLKQKKCNFWDKLATNLGH